MKCPICDVDLTPLDLVSRTEHVDLCMDRGPCVLEVGAQGELVVKQNISKNKVRKICPVCDKTFQNLHVHFKKCAIKYDLPPNLMLDYWDKINSESDSNKKFPREMLDMFVAKCIKEGRLGDQVDFARALSLSMSVGEPQTSNDVAAASTSSVQSVDETSQQSSEELLTAPPSVAQVLLQASASASTAKPASRKVKSSQKTPLQLTNEETKHYNIELRIERELAASRSKHYREAVQKENDDDDIVVIIEDVSTYPGKDTLFHRARMKDCDNSALCQQADCKNHDLLLLMEDFKVYAGPSMGQVQQKETEVK